MGVCGFGAVEALKAEIRTYANDEVFARFVRFYARFGHFSVDSDKGLHTDVGSIEGDLPIYSAS
jgi:hypothetical protein